VITQGNYRHFKGSLYRVVIIGKDSETQEPTVVYHKYPYPERRDERGLVMSFLKSPDWWIRPARMFEEEVVWPDGIKRPRFVREGD
jgi:hypothetical protein